MMLRHEFFILKGRLGRLGTPSNQILGTIITMCTQTLLRLRTVGPFPLLFQSDPSAITAQDFTFRRWRLKIQSVTLDTTYVLFGPKTMDIHIIYVPFGVMVISRIIVIIRS